MTFRELPRWMRVWIVLALTLFVANVAVCVVLGITSSRRDFDY